MSDRLLVAVDSNVIISALRSRSSRLTAIWIVPDVSILICEFVLVEVQRHLAQPDQRARLERILDESRLIRNGEEIRLPPAVKLPLKDQPVLQSAIAARADLLVTGDLQHFGALFDQQIEGVLVESTSAFKKRYPAQFPIGDAGR